MRVPINKKEDTTTLTLGRKTKRDVVIDSEDVEKVLRHHWVPAGGKGRIYFLTKIGEDRVYLHHLLFGERTSGMEIDHIDRNPLNNSKKNLREVTVQHNRRNRKNGNKHGFPGLYYLPEINKTWKGTSRTIKAKPWQVRIRTQDLTSPFKDKGKGTRLIHVGTFHTKEEAIEARRRAEEQYFGAVFH